MYDMGGVNRNALKHSLTLEQRKKIIEEAAEERYVEFTGGQGEYRTMPFRYVWPSELDLMAELAGMRLQERWAGWQREPFTSTSYSHVSIYEKSYVV